MRRLIAAGLVLAAAVVAASAVSAATPKPRSCADVVGPRWTYRAGTGKGAPVYRGTHYVVSVVRLTCGQAAPLVRKVAVVTWRGNGLKLLPGYGCGAGVLKGAQLAAGQCVSATSTGPTANPKSFSWTPDIQDRTSKRIS